MTSLHAGVAWRSPKGVGFRQADPSRCYVDRQSFGPVFLLKSSECPGEPISTNAHGVVFGHAAASSNARFDEDPEGYDAVLASIDSHI